MDESSIFCKHHSRPSRWVDCRYPPERVLQALHQAQAGNSLDLPHDPDGESLEYLFCFLKSHLALLQTLDPTQQVLIYGELNRS